MYVMSHSHFRFGPLAPKSWFTRFGDAAWPQPLCEVVGRQLWAHHLASEARHELRKEEQGRLDRGFLPQRRIAVVVPRRGGNARE
jgi:hypothetical protein